MNVEKVIIYLFAILLLFILMSCEKDTTPFYSVTDEFKNSLIPAYPGNSWTYIDTLFKSSETVVEQYTITIEDFVQDNSEIWWKTNWGFATATLFDAFMIQKDSIFKTISIASVPTTYKYSLEFFLLTEDSITFFPLEQSTASPYLRVGKKINEPIKIGNSYYNNCLSFTTVYDEYIICPGIGIISRVYKYNQYDVRKSILVDYHLNK